MKPKGKRDWDKITIRWNVKFFCHDIFVQRMNALKWCFSGPLTAAAERRLSSP